MRHLHRRILPVAIGVLLLKGTVEARTLTFEERVRAQEAIERVYYSYQTGARRPFDQAVPRALLERKARTYLKQTAALEEFWRTRVDSTMLRRELERMASHSRMPERLLRLYSALGDDPLLIQECLARPALVDRLSRSFFERDTTIHAGTRRMAEVLRRDLAGGRIDPWAGRAGRTVTKLVRIDPHAGPGDQDSPRARSVVDGDAVRELEAEEFDRYRSRLPGQAGDIGPIIEEGDAFIVHVVLTSFEGEARFATFTVPKLDWDGWWRQVEKRLDSSSVNVAEGADATGEPPAPDRAEDGTGSTCVPDDTWDNGSLDDWPEARSGHMAFWTGSLMLVWGGGSLAGGRYDPATDIWSPMSTAPGRSAVSGVWTGSELILWGYVISGVAGGARYDPVADTWSTMSASNAPSWRIGHTAVWSGSEMIVWGGTSLSVPLDTGGRYDPASDTWRPMSTAGAPAPRERPASVWTGDQMIVWGGYAGEYLASGGRYDPGTDTWLDISITGAPTARFGPTVIWSGTRMIVWGGSDSLGYQNTGGQYDPATDAWTPTSTTNAAAPRGNHSAVWNRQHMIVWGGFPSSTSSAGGRYDPVLDSWTPMSVANAPSPRAAHSAVWTGSLMVVWGGALSGEALTIGGRYDPLLDAWTPTADTNGPSARRDHAAIWTGSHLIVWGGRYFAARNTGARYEPATDTWSATSTADAPAPRFLHSAVWTGDRMIVWGGSRSTSTTLDTGGSYDPIGDTWTSTSVMGAPSPRQGHGAVWTGKVMIVWGGWNAGASMDTGGRYDPEADSWTPTSMTDAPSPRSGHPSIWTGSEMIVWGGNNFGGPNARYDPVLDRWTPMSFATFPTSGVGSSAVWTGRHMIVWGGDFGGQINDGGRYDPVTDAWTPTSKSGAPTPRSSHAAVWTGRYMIVWGGLEPQPGVGGDVPFARTGGRYDPASDTWAATPVLGAPAGREWHKAAWTGSHMFVWGGYDGAPVRTGGLYAFGHSVDDDGDGMSECQGDCNDGNSAVHPGALEICDSVDNDCDGLSDDAVPPIGVPFLTVEHAGDAVSLAWAPIGAATHYDLVRGDLPILLGTGGDFSAATHACLADDSRDTSLTSSGEPGAGSAFWYVLRPANCGGNGSYDSDDPAQVRPRDAGINASAASCP